MVWGYTYTVVIKVIICTYLLNYFNQKFFHCIVEYIFVVFDAPNHVITDLIRCLGSGLDLHISLIIHYSDTSSSEAATRLPLALSSRGASSSDVRAVMTEKDHFVINSKGSNGK